MKICFISLKSYPVFNPRIKSTFGGAEVQLSILAKEAAKIQGSQISVIVGDYGQRKIETRQKVKVLKVFSFKEIWIKKFWKFFKVLKQVNAGIYIQRGLSPYSFLIALWCKVYGRKFVYMLSNDGDADKNHPIFKGFFSHLCVNLLYKFANVIIVQHEYQKKKLKELFNINASILFSSDHPIENNKDNMNPKDIILWIGRMDAYYKRPELFLYLAKHFTKEKFVMVGPVATDQQEYFCKIKEKVKIISNLKFLEFVTFNQIGDYFKRAKIFVNTSYQEGFPHTFVGSLKYGVPIVSLNINPAGLFDRYKIGYFCNNDFNKMISVLSELLDDEKVRLEFSFNARRYFLSKHDITKNINKFLKIVS